MRADWSHPRIQNPACRIDAPSEDIASAAKAAFERRRDTYPQLVQAKQISADDARADLEGWRAIAKDWRWIAFGEGEPAGTDTLDARIAALDTAISRWFAQIDAKGGQPSEAEREQCELLCAMRWWAQADRNSFHLDHPRFCAGILHDWRRENGHPMRGAMLAARKPKERNAA